MHDEVTRTKTDTDRIEQMADAGGQVENVVNIDAGSRGFGIGSVTSSSQTRVLDEEDSPADAMRGGVVVDTGE